MRQQESGRKAHRSRGALISGTIAIAFIVGVSAVGYTRTMTTSKEATLRTNLHALNDAVSQYHADRGRYPVTLKALIEEHYLRSVPEDPSSRAAKRRVWTIASTSCAHRRTSSLPPIGGS